MIHRKTIQHFHEADHLHELTFSCNGRMPLLVGDDQLEKLARCIDAAGQETSVELVAFVFMPEHVHLLIYPTSVNASISRYLARVKQPFSKQVKEVVSHDNPRLLEQLMVRERPGKTCFRFWQEGPGFDRNLFSANAIAASLDYIHANPVKRGLCGRAVDWKWSSAKFYHEEPPGVQHAELPFVHGVPIGALE